MKTTPIAGEEARRQRLHATLWRRACKHDAIPPDSMFVVFSPDNPFALLQNNLLLANLAPRPHLPR